MFIFLCSSAFAAEFSIFAGGETDTRGQTFSYLGLDITQNVYEHISISGRLIPNYLRYKYRSGDETITASSPGADAVAGIKLNWGQTTFGVFGGTEFRNTHLSPDIKDAKVRGSSFAGLIQGEFDTWLPSRTNLNVFASYSGTDGFLYERGRIKQQITNLDFKKTNTINVGLEQFYGRNPNFHEVGVGVVAELYYIPKRVSFGVRTGYKHDSTFGNGVYGGLEFYIHL